MCDDIGGEHALVPRMRQPQYGSVAANRVVQTTSTHGPHLRDDRIWLLRCERTEAPPDHDTVVAASAATRVGAPVSLAHHDLDRGSVWEGANLGRQCCQRTPTI